METNFQGQEEGTVVLITNIGYILYPIRAVGTKLKLHTEGNRVGDTLDLGNVPVTEEQSQIVQIHNKGLRPVSLQSIYGEGISELKLVLQTDFLKNSYVKNKALTVPYDHDIELAIDSYTEFEVKVNPSEVTESKIHFVSAEGEELFLRIKMNPISGELLADPIDFPNVYLEPLVERQLVLSNSFPQSIKIKKVLSSSSHISTRITDDLVPAFQSKPVALASFKMSTGEFEQDFSRVLTLNEFNVWKDLVSFDYQYFGHISIQTDLVKELYTDFSVRLEKPQLVPQTVEFLSLIHI